MGTPPTVGLRGHQDERSRLPPRKSRGGTQLGSSLPACDLPGGRHCSHTEARRRGRMAAHGLCEEPGEI